MIFTTKRKRLVDVSLQIDGHIINETHSTKFLGVIIDNKLSWKIILNMLLVKFQGV